jgi:hypothetical protein
MADQTTPEHLRISSMKYLYEALAKPTRLYIKQCPHCGLRYFGKTVVEDIEKYQGSGIVWSRHLKKHGVEPIHLWNSDWYYDMSIGSFALKFSHINRIVESSDWANIKNEDAIQGGDPGPMGRQKISDTVNSQEWKSSIGKKNRKKQSQSLKERMSDPVWKSTVGVERIKKIKNAHNDPLWKSTVKEQANQQMRLTKADPDWKATIGVQRSLKAGKKQSQTLNDPSWKATVGEHKRKRSSEIQNDPEWKAKKYKTCEHCGKGPMSPGNYTRHHGDNCKSLIKP